MPYSDIVKAGNVAVVTGAASGIGKAACMRFATAGMAVYLVDLPGDNLTGATDEVAEVHPNGDNLVAAFPVDISAEDALSDLSRRVTDRFGKVDLLMNNAVTRSGRGHDAPLEDWRHAMEVNFWAIVKAIRVFLPEMQASATPAMIINVGSKQGITNPPGHPIYNITKSALKTYTEALEHELRSQEHPSVTAHLLVPGWTTTGNKPHQKGAWMPEQVIDFMTDKLGRGEFYILCPDDEVSTERDHRRIIWAAEDITKNRVPLSRWHPDFKTEAQNNC